MNNLSRHLTALVLVLCSVVFCGSCRQTITYTGSGGCIEVGDTRIHHYIDNGTSGEAQRVLLVLGKCAYLGISNEGVSWSRSSDVESNESSVRDSDTVWIVWEDDAVTAVDVEATEIAGMIRAWSDGQPVPKALATLIERERSEGG